ncbi:PIG-L family deacetylase [Shimazuella sp. AN120528]|uniref:PIG-L family deacetylase n=1 Tax=Shimazuella soli TaxID=1892854 RepID=UPI001F101EE4|nr:PIG-L family deacetylase [Shimazuella soli]MCH5584824.1 PIG-L family deacetylase [Shimazuella soli]
MGPAIFFIPHQDDETLQAAVDILNHLGAGREVIVVLYTTGKGSFVQGVLNGDGTSAYWGTAHNPYLEGYESLTDDDFSTARNREFCSALGQLGVTPESIHIQPVDLEGGPVNKDTVKALMMEYVNIYGLTASYKAMSYYDTSDSHKYSGQALLELYNEGIVTDARFYIARSDWALSRPGTTYTATSAQKDKIKKAARCYEAWNPVSGAFAIGYHSIYAQFNAYLANPQNKIHKPNE